MVYYFDVLPLHFPPQNLESFTSYLIRLVNANNLKSVYDLAALSGAKNWTSWMHSADFPCSSYGDLAQIANILEEQLLSTTFFYIGKNFGCPSHLYSLHRFLERSVASGLRYCPLCLAEQSTPYYSLTWRFHFVIGCATHKCELLDHCGYCGASIPLLTPCSQITYTYFAQKGRGVWESNPPGTAPSGPPAVLKTVRPTGAPTPP